MKRRRPQFTLNNSPKNGNASTSEVVNQPNFTDDTTNLKNLKVLGDGSLFAKKPYAVTGPVASPEKMNINQVIEQVLSAPINSDNGGKTQQNVTGTDGSLILNTNLGENVIESVLALGPIPVVNMQVVDHSTVCGRLPVVNTQVNDPTVCSRLSDTQQIVTQHIVTSIPLQNDAAGEGCYMKNAAGLSFWLKLLISYSLVLDKELKKL